MYFMNVIKTKFVFRYQYFGFILHNYVLKETHFLKVRPFPRLSWILCVCVSWLVSWLPCGIQGVHDPNAKSKN